MRAEDFTLDSWGDKEYSRLFKYLQKEAEEEYRQFSEKLIPDCKNILGVRMPKLRVLGKHISKGDWRGYLSISRNDIFEEIVLKGIVIGLAQVGFEELCELFKLYLPLVDNWAICDYFCGGLKRIKKFEKEFLPMILDCLKSEDPWQRRVGLVMLRTHYVKEEHLEMIFESAEFTMCEHYYVQMAHAWLIAECYTKYPQKTYEYLEKCSLGTEILNKTVQKIRDSCRVSAFWKEKATAFRRKK